MGHYCLAKSYTFLQDNIHRLKKKAKVKVIRKRIILKVGFKLTLGRLKAGQRQRHGKHTKTREQI